MLDLVGAIALAALAVVTTASLVLVSPLVPATRARLLALGAVWLLLVTGLAAAGVFATVGVPAIGVAIVAPLAIAVLRATRDTPARTLALGIPLPALVLANVGRLLGALFLVLHSQGRLPATFALTAGWGDIGVALLAIPVAWLAHRGVAGWRPLTLGWNVVGFVDLVTAVTLGVGSNPRSPVRFIYEEAVPDTLATLPWALIPAFLVPLYLLTHLALFARLWTPSRPLRSRVAAHAGH
jgi:hypothetical protein